MECKGNMVDLSQSTWYGGSQLRNYEQGMAINSTKMQRVTKSVRNTEDNKIIRFKEGLI